MEEKKPHIQEEELAIIRGVFCENTELLQAMRALFFGLEVTEQEKELIKSTFADKKLLALVKKRFYPVIDKKTPIGQVQDVWLGAEQMVFGRDKDSIRQAIEYKREALKMTEKGLALLENPDGERVSVYYDPSLSNDELAIDLLARNQYVRHVESQLNILMVIAGKKAETDEEVRKRLGMDSTK